MKVLLGVLLCFSLSAMATQYEACVTDKGEIYGFTPVSNAEIPVPLVCKKSTDWRFTFNSEGIPGAQGIQGEQGIQGITGETGSTGPAGDDYDPALEDRVEDLEYLHAEPWCELTRGENRVDVSNNIEYHTLEFRFEGLGEYIGNNIVISAFSGIPYGVNPDDVVVTWYEGDDIGDPFLDYIADGLIWHGVTQPTLAYIGRLQTHAIEAQGYAKLVYTLGFPVQLDLPSPNPTLRSSLTLMIETGDSTFILTCD